MALWVDKQRPTTLAALSYHKEQAAALTELVHRDDFPHLLIYGPSGAGKKTRVAALLHELYGAGVHHQKLETRQFTAPSGRKLELQTVSSNYHIELTPGDVGVFDRVVVQDVVKQMAQTSQIDSATQRVFKVVVLHEMDALSRDAQHALRRTMEKYSGNCRLILVSNTLSRVIEPLRSRCMAIRVPAPTDAEIRNIVSSLYYKESGGHSLPESAMRDLLSKSHGNLRRALLMLEAAHARHAPITENDKMPSPEWEVYLRETAEIVLKRQSADTLLTVRNRLYELLSRCIPASVIFTELVDCLLPRCPPSIRCDVLEEAAEYEHRLTRGQKAIFHLEAFIAAFMFIYQKEQK